RAGLGLRDCRAGAHDVRIADTRDDRRACPEESEAERFGKKVVEPKLLTKFAADFDNLAVGRERMLGLRLASIFAPRHAHAAFENGAHIFLPDIPVVRSATRARTRPWRAVAEPSAQGSTF